MSLKQSIPNSITSMNLLSGAMGVISTFQGEMGQAFFFLLAAAVFDFCDGLAARLLKVVSPMGKELDSLSDMVSFGLLPSVMLVKTLWMLGVTSLVSWLPLFLAVMSGLRLAKFNVDERQTADFIGLPTPSSAAICASLCYFIYFQPDSLLAAWAAHWWVLPLLALVLGLLLVSEIPMFGMKVAPGHKLLDTKRIVLLVAVVGCILLTVLLHQNWSLAVLLVFSFYLGENLLLAFIRLLRR